MHRGYVKFYRKTLESEVTSRGLFHLGLLTWLILKANRVSGWFRDREILPGQLATSYRSILEQTGGSSLSAIYRALQSLVDDETVSIENVKHQFIIITLNNWSIYNSCGNGSETGKEQELEQAEVQAEVQEKNVLKNIRSKESKNNNPPTPFSSKIDYPEGFDTPTVRASVEEWHTHRKAIRKTVTPSSVSKRMKQLETPARFIAAVDYSIAQGWTGIYEEKQNGHTQGTFGSGQVGRPSGGIRNQSPARPRDRYGPGGCGAGNPEATAANVPTVNP